MRILFVRHGTSLANASAVVGTPETPLAEAGLEQARIVGQDLKNENITLIVCSGFIRAQQTAETIAAELGIPINEIKIVEELGERRMGELEGKPKEKPTEFFYENDSDLGFEPQKDLITRMKLALTKVKELASQTAGTALIVGHATSGFYLLQVAKGKESFDQFDKVNQLNNAEFVEVEIAT